MNEHSQPQVHVPAIVAPVSRFLAVADVPQSLAFYRDVLGFEVRSIRDENGGLAEAEIVSGPAKLQLAVGDRAYDSTGALRPRGSAILFFQTDDVSAMRTQFSRTAECRSELEKVNWIKMRMFEIRDPDGHAIWFGQSFQQPSRNEIHSANFRKALPQLPVDDVPAAVAYYRDVLGFRVNYASTSRRDGPRRHHDPADRQDPAAHRHRLMLCLHQRR